MMQPISNHVGGNAMTVRYAMRTDIGKVRASNEDATLVMPDSGVYAVADGMGGHNAGEVASTLALESISSHLRDIRPALRTLQHAVQEANMALIRRGRHDPALRGMGTTLTLLCAAKDSAVIAQVGDSRCYLLRDGALRQCTEDHSMVAELVRQGALSPEEGRNHPYRNVITRALGTSGYVEADLIALELQAGDRCLLCSDGLTGMVEDGDIAVLLETPDIEEAADALLAAALDAGGHDNVTLVVLEWRDEEEAAR
jgi:protein phosphatase